MDFTGAKRWVVPDGYLPPRLRRGEMENHEALMLVNTGDKPVEVCIMILFSDREPIRDLKYVVPAERVICIRMDRPDELHGIELPILTQYALVIEATEKIAVQFARVDTTQSNLAYYSCISVSN